MLIVFFRTLILYTIVVIVMRIMGKRQIGELEPFELVVIIMISELAAIPMGDTEIPLISGIVPILTLLLVQVTLSYLSLKSERARAIICGRPSILIERGKILEDELRRLRINVNELLEQLRGKDYPNIAEVDYAILETNGQLNVIPKGAYRPIVTSDLGIGAKDPGLPLTLIVDGEIIKHNFEKAGLTDQSFQDLIKKHGITNPKEILLASIDNAGDFFYQKKEGAQ